MLENMLMVAQKVLLLFLLMGVGFLTAKMKMISRESASQITDFVITFVTPCVIISAFQVDRGVIGLDQLGKLFLYSLIIHVIAIGICHFLFRRRPEDEERVMRFGCIYSNCGFMGIPLVQSILGNEGVVYASAFLAIFNLLAWTHGVSLMGKGEGGISWKKAVLTPGTIGLAIAFPLFLFSIRIPEPIHSAVNFLANLNTPLAMVCVGVFIAGVNLRSVFKEGSLYLVCFFRLLFFPALSFLLLWAFGADRMSFLACLLQAAGPCATILALLAAKYDRDAEMASKLVALSTLLSILTIPLFTALGELMF